MGLLAAHEKEMAITFENRYKTTNTPNPYEFVSRIANSEGQLPHLDSSSEPKQSAGEALTYLLPPLSFLTIFPLDYFPVMTSLLCSLFSFRAASGASSIKNVFYGTTISVVAHQIAPETYEASLHRSSSSSSSSSCSYSLSSFIGSLAQCRVR